MASLQIPVFKMPEFLDKPPTGRLELDLVPLITMLACFPTLLLFYRKKRYADFAAYSIGFFVAVIYHMLHLAAHEGLAKVSFLGIHGAAWRTVDIVAANVLLARTMGHALNIDHPLIAVIPNALLPIVIVAMLFILGDGAVGVAEVSRVTVLMMGLTMVLQLGQGGINLLRHIGGQYSHPRALRGVTSMACGIFAFTMPSRQPQNYWIWHSVWHVLMGLGYYDLYGHLLHVANQQESRQQAVAQLAKKQTKAGGKAYSAKAGAGKGGDTDWFSDIAGELKAAVGAARAAVAGVMLSMSPVVTADVVKDAAHPVEVVREAAAVVGEKGAVKVGGQERGRKAVKADEARLGRQRSKSAGRGGNMKQQGSGKVAVAAAGESTTGVTLRSHKRRQVEP